MGLFDKIIKEGSKVLQDVTSDENKEKATAFLNNLKTGIEETAKEIASDENKEKAASFLNSVKDSLGDFKNQIEQEVQESKKQETYYEYREDGKTCREKILEVLASDFSQYTVKENVSPVTIGGTGKFMNYSIVVYDGTTPKLFIMIIGKTTTAHREYRWSRQEAEKNGYTFLNFVNHYPNTIEYITDRLHQYL